MAAPEIRSVPPKGTDRIFIERHNRKKYVLHLLAYCEHMDILLVVITLCMYAESSALAPYILTEIFVMQEPMGFITVKWKDGRSGRYC